jgi:hypothetical protein
MGKLGRCHRGGCITTGLPHRLLHENEMAGRLTPQEDAAIQEEIRREVPQIDHEIDGIMKHLQELSDVGKIYVTAVVTATVIRALVDERDEAVALSKHMQSQVEGLLLAMKFES